MSDPNVATARRWFEQVWNCRSADAVCEMLTPESSCDSNGVTLTGPEAFLANAHRPFLAALPDVRVEVEAVVSDGEWVAVRWLAAGTHTGDGFGFPASGKSVSFRGTTWMRCENGKLVEGYDTWNRDGLMASLQPR